MLPFRLFSVIALIGCLAFSTGASAAIDSNAPIIKLRSVASGGCTEAGISLHNCFTDTTAMSTWIVSTRKPLKASPLVVDIGPGWFGRLTCLNDPSINFTGYISFKGAGIDKTFFGAVTLDRQCANVTFDQMTIGTGSGYAVAVLARGTTTTWTNVKVVGGNLWAEWGCIFPGAVGRHTWYGSQLVGTLGGSYQVGCDESWFYGSEISSSGSLADNDVIPLVVNGAELHVYGSVIRALGTGTTASYAITAVKVAGGEAHIHGTGIDVFAVDKAPAAVTALLSTGGMIHVNATSYNMKTGPGGTKTRISDPLKLRLVHAPYMWEPHTTLPDVVSVTGADTVIVTDGAQPHLVIYSESCPGAKWFDTSTNACR